MRTMRNVSALLALVAGLGLASASAGVKIFVGLGFPNSDWDRSENWSPAGTPGADDTVIIANTGSYVAVTGKNCVAHTVIIENGGRLVISKSDNGKKLTVMHDFIVETGGTFNTAGSSGSNGPVVYIAGDIVNDGTWDLRGVSSGSAGVVFNGQGTQTISGSSALLFQNFTNSPNDSLLVAGSVTVVGTVSPLIDCAVYTIGDGSFVNGEPPLPITLAWFAAAFEQADGCVVLRWQTLSEIDNYGFYVERKRIDAAEYEVIGFCPGAGHTAVPQTYDFADRTVSSGSWHYRLRQIDLDGSQVVFEPRIVDIQGVTSVGGDAAPGGSVLHQNYPNPFNPSTRISFTTGSAGRAVLRVYTSLGELVATLFDGPSAAGERHEVTFDAAGLAGGMYLYRLEAAASTGTGRMILLR